jgi:hypothetical protein
MKLFRPTFRDGRADVFPELEREFGLGMTTPSAAARLFELIAGEGRQPRGLRRDDLDPRDAAGPAMIPRSLPFEREEILVANNRLGRREAAGRLGRQGDVRSDPAYVKSPKARYVIAICARRIRDKRASVDNEALVAGAELSRMVYDVFNPLRNPSR